MCRFNAISNYLGLPTQRSPTDRVKEDKQSTNAEPLNAWPMNTGLNLGKFMHEHFFLFNKMDLLINFNGT